MTPKLLWIGLGNMGRVSEYLGCHAQRRARNTGRLECVIQVDTETKKVIGDVQEYR